MDNSEIWSEGLYQSVDRSFGFNPMRLETEDLYPMFASLKKGATGGPAFPNVWGVDAGGNPKKDYSRVAFVADGSRRGGSQSTIKFGAKEYTYYITTSNSEETYIDYVAEAAPSRVMELSPFALEVTMLPGRARTLIHEFSHAFEMGDEYGARSGAITADDKDTIRGYYNTLLEEDITVAAVLDADKIKWRWPRVAKAAVLKVAVAAQVGGGPNDYNIKIKEAPAVNFIVGDEVYLRKAVLVDPKPGQIHHDQFSARFKVLTKVSETEFVIQKEAGPAPTGANFPAGSVMLCLVPAEYDGAGTISHVIDGSKKVIGAGSHFRFQVRVGDYIGADLGAGMEMKEVVGVTNDTEIIVDSEFSAAIAVVDARAYRIFPVHTFKGSGTVNIPVGTAVTGTGTQFTKELRVGDYLKVGANKRQITAVGSNTSLTLQSAFPAVIAAGTAYDVSPLKNYAELIESNIRRAITTSNKPMTLVPCVPTGVGVEEQVFDATTLAQIVDSGGTSVIPLLTRPVVAEYNKVVGLYAGAKEYACGAHHPTGFCIMRSTSNGRDFCPVCRYTIVDQIDPKRHGELDIDLTAIYPKI